MGTAAADRSGKPRDFNSSHNQIKIARIVGIVASDFEAVDFTVGGIHYALAAVDMCDLGCNTHQKQGNNRKGVEEEQFGRKV